MKHVFLICHFLAYQGLHSSLAINSIQFSRLLSVFTRGTATGKVAVFMLDTSLQHQLKHIRSQDKLEAWETQSSLARERCRGKRPMVVYSEKMKASCLCSGTSLVVCQEMLKVSVSWRQPTCSNSVLLLFLTWKRVPGDESFWHIQLWQPPQSPHLILQVTFDYLN